MMFTKKEKKLFDKIVTQLKKNSEKNSTDNDPTKFIDDRKKNKE